MSEFDQLNDQVLNAHQVGDSKTLSDIYHMLGQQELADDHITAGCFLLTQAYVYALEAGDPRVPEIHKILMAHGREE